MKWENSRVQYLYPHRRKLSENRKVEGSKNLCGARKTSVALFDTYRHGGSCTRIEDKEWQQQHEDERAQLKLFPYKARLAISLAQCFIQGGP